MNKQNTESITLQLPIYRNGSDMNHANPSEVILGEHGEICRVPYYQAQAGMADFIVRACNSHAALVEALEITVSRFEWLAKHNATASQAPWIDCSLREARAALALAKGGQQ